MVYETASLKHASLTAAISVLIAMASSPQFVSAQPTQSVVEVWRSTDFAFNGKMLDTDVGGNAYVLGDNPATNILNIRKYNSAGSLLWQNTYDDPIYNLSGVWIATDPAQGVVVLANIVRSTDGQPSGWLTLKYDTNGSLLWVNPLPRAYSSAARLAVDFFGNIYVAGTGVLTKYSPQGTTLWQDDTGAVGQPYSLAVSFDGARIALAGKSGVTGLDFRATMFDAKGSLLWANTSSALYPGNDVAFRPSFDYESYYATGTYSPLDPNPYQMAIAKFDGAGNLSWLKSYSVGDRAFRVGVDPLGNILATGIDANGYMDWMTIKTDPNGNLLWSRRYDGGRNNDETPNMLAIDAAGSVYVTGTGGPNPSSGTLSNLKGVVAKYASDGTPVWARWDVFAGGRAISIDKVDPMGLQQPLTTLGWGYFTVARYSQTGLADAVPAAPANLSGVASFSGSSYQAVLTFSDRASNEFWVEAERCAGSGCTNFTRVAQSRGEDATSLVDATVSRGTTYTYRVKALGFMGLSGPSNTVEIVIPPLSPPAAPSNLTASTLSRSEIRLGWTNNAANQTGVRIERCRGSNCTNFSLLRTVPGNTSSYTNSGLSSNTTFRYRVSGYNDSGNSSYSNIAGATTLRR